METTVAKSTPPTPRRLAARTPAVDIFESDVGLVIHADVPGASAESVRLEVEQGLLRFSADTPTATWSRSFLVPRGISVDAIRAELVAGVLRIDLPKSPDIRRRTVEVKAG